MSGKHFRQSTASKVEVQTQTRATLTPEMAIQVGQELLAVGAEALSLQSQTQGSKYIVELNIYSDGSIGAYNKLDSY